MLRSLPPTLPVRPRLALLVSDALGNFCVATLIAQGLARLAPDLELHWFSGPRTQELEEAWPRIARRVDCAQARPEQLPEVARQAGCFDLVVNLDRDGIWPALAGHLAADAMLGPATRDGHPLAYPDGPLGDLWRDDEWTHPEILRRHPVLETGFIGEILWKAFGFAPHPANPWPGAIPRYELPAKTPTLAVPPFLIATGASRADKIWPLEAWRHAIETFPERPGLLGARPEIQSAHYNASALEDALVAEGRVVDLRGRLTLPEVVRCVQRARLLLTVDNGILHFAAASDTPTVGLFRPGIHRLWAPPNPNLAVLTDPRGVAHVEAERVVERVRRALSIRLVDTSERGS